LTLGDNITTALRKNQGSPAPRRIGAVIDADLASAADGDASGSSALQRHFEAWSLSPDVYAVVLRASLWPPAPAPLSALELAASTRLAWCLDCFPKPLVALSGGALAGPPLALASVATHRVGGDAYRFTVPPITAANCLPLGGVAHALARLPGASGLYLAMTGAEIGQADASAIGLLTHCIPDAATPEIIAALADSQPVDPVLDGLDRAMAAAPLAPHRATLDHCFSAPDPQTIAARLAAVTGPDAAWAETTLTALQRHSAPVLAATYRLVSEAQHLDLRESLLLSYKLAVRLKAADLNALSLEQLFSADSIDDFSLPSRSDIAFGRF
jgi:enoyl-CoA hydratase/carnithine racemase